jgi:hypothetical protein
MEVVEHLHCANPAAPVVLLTAHDAEEATQEARRHRGASEFVVKHGAYADTVADRARELLPR